MNHATQLLTELYTSREVAEVVKRLRPAELQQDMLQHVFTELFAKDPAEIEEKHEQGRLRGYVALMLYNTAKHYKGKFHREQGRDRAGQLIEVSTDFSAIESCSGSLDLGDMKEAPQMLDLRKYIASINMSNGTDIEAEILEADLLRKLSKAIDALKWYDRGVLELYMQAGTYDEASRRTGIPRVSLFTTVRKVKHQLSKILNDE